MKSTTLQQFRQWNFKLTPNREKKNLKIIQINVTKTLDSVILASLKAFNSCGKSVKRKTRNFTIIFEKVVINGKNVPKTC